MPMERRSGPSTLVRGLGKLRMQRPPEGSLTGLERRLAGGSDQLAGACVAANFRVVDQGRNRVSPLCSTLSDYAA